MSEDEDSLVTVHFVPCTLCTQAESLRKTQTQPSWGQEYTAVLSPLLTETSEASSVTEVDVGTVVPIACLNDMNSPCENGAFITSFPGPSTQK